MKKKTMFVKYKNLILNTKTRELSNGEKMIVLSEIKSRIMGLLLRNPYRIFSREDILMFFWGEKKPTKGAINSHMSELQLILYKYLNVVGLIKTVRLKGYCIDFQSNANKCLESKYKNAIMS